MFRNSKQNIAPPKFPQTITRKLEPLKNLGKPILRGFMTVGIELALQRCNIERKAILVKSKLLRRCSSRRSFFSCLRTPGCRYRRCRRAGGTGPSPEAEAAPATASAYLLQERLALPAGRWIRTR